LIVGGFLALPALKRQIPIVLTGSARSEGTPENVQSAIECCAILDGKPFNLSEPAQRGVISVHLKNLPALLAMTILAVSSMTLFLSFGAGISRQILLHRVQLVLGGEQ